MGTGAARVAPVGHCGSSYTHRASHIRVYLEEDVVAHLEHVPHHRRFPHDEAAEGAVAEVLAGLGELDGGQVVARDARLLQPSVERRIERVNQRAAPPVDAAPRASARKVGEEI